MTVDPTSVALPDWLDEARARHRSHPYGSLALLDADATRRGLSSVTNGVAVPVGRRLRAPAAGESPVHLDVRTHQAGIYTSTYDVLRLDCHGTEVTHMDALNHFGVLGTFYGTARPDPADGVDIATLADQPIVTRAVFLDLVEQIDGDHATVERAFGAAELQAALDRSGTQVLPGDALVLYMGRERFEAGGGRFAPLVESANGRPGLADDGARWLSEQPVGVIAWDFLEAHPHRELGLAVHALSWAVGVVLIDNCDLGALHEPIIAKPERTGLLVASPLRVEGATGCAVNPVVIL